MKKIIYPCIFYKEEDSYWAEFPDLEGCQTFGDTIEEVLKGAKEALSGYLITLIEQGKFTKEPSDIFNIKLENNAFVSLIEADIMKYKKSVKKTLTIPMWLNDIAEKNNINFSKTLQDALIIKLTK
ncbi:MAG: type II toxin-antitoxin system HicB family antitoxin [Defluviitaleaceae bacterium]|nr:type II toxin-antitoxin system HicB family antitoxin [Defluviitaleaceae bacterium]